MPATSVGSLRERLESIDQAHLLRFWDELSEPQRERLARQIAALDADIPNLVRKVVLPEPEAPRIEHLEPAPYYPADPASGRLVWDRHAMRRSGEELIGAGAVACFTVAGGQGTRLGFDGPKGCFAAGAVTGKPLFQIFAEGILASGRRYGTSIPWYVMTSPLNHEPTVAFFREHDHFGLDPADVVFFPQGVMPSFDKATGRILLAGKGEIATNPDGHGGAIRALVESGATEDMAKRGVAHISYFQVDNPLVRVVDPVFLGLHVAPDASSGEMSSKMLAKAYPEEKVGVFCTVGGRVTMIEYSDLPAELAEARDASGELRFIAGNPAIHILSVAFVRRLHEDPQYQLPFHRAEKKVACIDLESGRRIEPESPNAVKLERFIFDALPSARRSVVLETERVEEFAPIKNAEGVDSVQSSRLLQTERAARWLEAAGVEVPRTESGEPDCTLEISPLTALDAADLRGADLPRRIERGSRLAL